MYVKLLNQLTINIMEELTILKYQAEVIANALRLVSNSMESSKKETCLDREICKSIEFINNILKPKSNFSDLKVGDTIELIENGETFTIDRIFDGGWVDMTSTKQFNPELGLDFHQTFFSIKLDNFKIINK